MKKIRVAIIGVGNCAKSLIEGTILYQNQPGSTAGLMFPSIGGYGVDSIEYVLGFDIDARKVGRRLYQAMNQKPNCAKSLCSYEESDAISVAGGRVHYGRLRDGVADHMMTDSPESGEGFYVCHDPTEESSDEVCKNRIVGLLKEAQVDVALIYLPVGSRTATRFYVQCLLAAKVPFVNCIPEFIVSDWYWGEQIKQAGIPAIGDDMRSQIGASVLSQCLQEMILNRGGKVKFHCQTNIGGNTDFRNMIDIGRTESKKISKENVIWGQNILRGQELDPHSVHAGPSDYVPYLKDTKVAHIRIEGEGFGGFPFELDVKLKVEDSPNSAGIVIDAIRYLMTARDMGVTGPLYGPSAFTQKTPPRQLTFDEAFHECKRYANRS